MCVCDRRVWHHNMDEGSAVPPLDVLMTRLGLTNAQLVQASTEQLTFKMVQKARKGRALSPNIQAKILAALLTVNPGVNVTRLDLFPDAH